MATTVLPPSLRLRLRHDALKAVISVDEFSDAEAFSLFEWYVRENGKLVERMLAEENAYVQEQTSQGNLDAAAESDGRIAIDYYIKRSHYAHVIYLASLFETYLTRACSRLGGALGDHVVSFRLDELAGDKWTKRRKFLERYGQFSFPASEWSAVELFIRVRNILVHENGNLQSVSAPERNAFATCAGLTVDGHALVIEHGYIQKSLSVIQSLVGFVNEQVSTSINRAPCPQVVKG